MGLRNYLGFSLCLILCNTCNFGTVDALIGRNVRSADENEFPFIVAIAKYYLHNGERTRYTCAGTLVSRKEVLTSEHCISDEYLEGLQVLVGSSLLDSGLRFYPQWWITYDQWLVINGLDATSSSSSNDIAILSMVKIPREYIASAHIWTSGLELLYGQKTTAVGWGVMRNNSVPNNLQVGELTVITKEECAQKVSWLSGENVIPEDNLICTVSNPYILLRPGDSGAPLLYNNLIVGINSGTAPFPAGRIYPEQVNVHVLTSRYYDFISELRDDYD